jgi:hypothetical protein
MSSEIKNNISIECYDPQTDTWTDLPPLPKGRGEAVAVVL